MALFGDYTKAGPGVDKNAPQKKPFFRFIELYFRKFWKLIGLNFLTFLCCLPIITIGPAIAGMTKVLKLYSMERPCDVLSDFWSGFSKNFKQAFPVGLIDLLVFSGVIMGLRIYPQMAESTGNTVFYYALSIISAILGFTFLMMNFYIFPMLVSVDLPLADILKNSFYLTCLGLKTNIITLLIYALTLGLTFVSTVFVSVLNIVAVPIFILSFLGYVSVFNSYPIIQKYVIDPYYEQRGEDNPEYDYLKPLDPEDSVFVDMGGKEAPIEGRKKHKTIS